MIMVSLSVRINNPIIINVYHAVFKKESPPSLVAHVNVCILVITPVSCRMHVNTSISNRANRDDT